MTGRGCRPQPRRAARSERGGGSLLAVCLAMVTLAAAAGLALVLVGLGATHRARAAADLAALAGVQALVRGEPPCSAAATVARLNGARVARCEPQGERVVIVAAVPAGWRLPGLPREVEARAAAEPVG